MVGKLAFDFFGGAMMIRTRLLSAFALILLLYGCNSGKREIPSICTTPKDGYSISDIAGTWIAGYVSHPQVRDTLIIRTDGMYKQIIHVEIPSIDYESDWQPWHLEYLGSTTYLYMTGMTLCAYRGDTNCKTEEKAGFTYDPCMGHTVKMPADEIWLIVLKGWETEPGSLSYGDGPISSWTYVRETLQTPTPSAVTP
jgi:hypothetical protein